MSSSLAIINNAPSHNKGTELLSRTMMSSKSVWDKKVMNMLLGAPSQGSGSDAVHVEDIANGTTAFDSKKREHKVADSMAQTIIMNNCSSDIALKLVGCVTAREMWVLLEKEFPKKNTGCHKLQFATSLLTMAQGGSESIVNYADRVKTLEQKVETAGLKFPEELTALIFLNGVRDVFKSAAKQIITGPADDVTIANAESKLELIEISEDNNSQRYEHGLVTVVDDRDEEIAYLTAELQLSRDRDTKTRECRNWSRTGKCSYGDKCIFSHEGKKGTKKKYTPFEYSSSYCSLPGHSHHSRKDCPHDGDWTKWVKNKQLQITPRRGQTIKYSRTTPQSGCKDKRIRNRGWKRKTHISKRACTNPKLDGGEFSSVKKGHTTIKTQFCFFSSPGTTDKCVMPQSKTKDWYLDSGATKHMSHDVSLFEDVVLSQSRKVKLGNGATIPVVGVGKVRISTSCG